LEKGGEILGADEKDILHTIRGISGFGADHDREKKRGVPEGRKKERTILLFKEFLKKKQERKSFHKK